jgi:hypothetical protein
MIPQAIEEADFNQPALLRPCSSERSWIGCSKAKNFFCVDSIGRRLFKVGRKFGCHLISDRLGHV